MRAVHLVETAASLRLASRGGVNLSQNRIVGKLVVEIARAQHLAHGIVIATGHLVSQREVVMGLGKRRIASNHLLELRDRCIVSPRAEKNVPDVRLNDE